MRMVIGLGAALLVTAAPANAQPVGRGDSAEPRVGSVNFRNEGNAAAQPHFQRGAALLHNFEYETAAAAFRQAQAADPGFVMAYWGEAMTHNHPLWEEQDVAAARAVLAKLGATPVQRATKARSPREAAWLGAVETLYGEGSKEERDLAYRARMRALFEADPADVDARAFYALSILGASPGGRQLPAYMEAAGLLEVGFMEHELHPGVLHYLIHSYDDPVHAPLGLRAAERYATVAPDAGHAQHMVSHIFHALGRWQDSERANINADAVVDRQRAAQGKPENSCGHYNEWLAYALSQQGKDASGIVAACRAQAVAEAAAKADLGRTGGWRSAGNSYANIALRWGIDTGQWPEPVGWAEGTYLKGRFDLAYGRLLAARAKPAAAAAALAEMKQLSAGFVEAMRMEMPNERTLPSWQERAIAQGEAVVALANGETERGLRMLEAAAEAEAALPVVFGPPAIEKPSYELLGDELLALGRSGEAAEAYRKSLAFAPGRRLSLAGLQAATR